MIKQHRVPLTLFCLAAACYMLSWFEAASGLAFFGVLFEVAMWIALSTESTTPPYPPVAPADSSAESHETRV